MSSAGIQARRLVEIVAQTRVAYGDPAPSLDDLRWVLRQLSRVLPRVLRALLLAALGAKPPRRQRRRDPFA
jgi:hypothetical protein